MEIEKGRKVDIFLHKNGIGTAIPYIDECTDKRYNIEKYSKVCIFKVSNPLVYEFARRKYACLLYRIDFSPKAVGAEKVAYYFASIDEDSVIFENGYGRSFQFVRAKKKSMIFNSQADNERHGTIHARTIQRPVPYA